MIDELRAEIALLRAELQRYRSNLYEEVKKALSL